MNAESIHNTSPMQGARKPQPIDDAKKTRLQKAVTEFEALFVGYIIKNMRSGIPKDELFGEGFGNDLMQGMFDAELAKHVAANSNLGLAEMMYKKLTGEQIPRPAQRPVPMEHREQPARGMPLKPTSVPAGSKPKTSVLKSDPTLNERLEKYGAIIDEAAARHGVDSSLIKAIIAAESAAKPNAQSAKEAKGLMQLVDSTAAEMGVKSIWDPEENIFGGTKYLRQMLDRFQGDLELALASYNAGPGAVERHKGIPPYGETQQYIEKVTDLIQYFDEKEWETHDER
jgi:soluble lytic murein transglycosylase-like protein